MDPLTKLIRDKLIEGQFPLTAPYVERFKEKFPNGLLGVVFYGSMLSETTSTGTSFPDFFLVVEDYKTFYRKAFHAFLNRTLPPNIYYMNEKAQSGEETFLLKCKYNVISLTHLEKEIATSDKDLYHLGRFTKRVALLYGRDETVADRLACSIHAALLSLTPYALTRMSERFSAIEFGKALLRLSYEGEVRVEKNEEKVEKLYEACGDYYSRLFPMLLDEFAKNRPDIRLEVDSPANAMYRLAWTAKMRSDAEKSTSRLMRRSRRRGMARWPKGILLVDNWVDILLDKVERTHGYKIELTPMERRFVLILGWKHFFRLLREGKIR